MTTPNVGEDGEELKLASTADGSVKWHNRFGKLFGNFLKVKNTISLDETTQFLDFYPEEAHAHIRFTHKCS